MTILDTYKYGQLYVDAALTISRLEDEQTAFEDPDDLTCEATFPGETREFLRKFEESAADFTFDEDYPYASPYTVDGDTIPWIRLGDFGGYPGGALDRANAVAAGEFARGSSSIIATSSWFGGCECVTLWFVITDGTTEEDVDSAIEMVEVFMDYPVLDEDLYSEYDREAWDETIRESIHESERDLELEFTDAQRETIVELAGNFFGYWEEGYFAQDEWDEIIEEVLGEEPGTVVQLHQADKLF